MKRTLIIMLAAMGGCLLVGCISHWEGMGIHWVVDSIPPGLWGWDIEIAAYTVKSSVDPLKGIDLLLGMLPIK